VTPLGRLAAEQVRLQLALRRLILVGGVNLLAMVTALTAIAAAQQFPAPAIPTGRGPPPPPPPATVTTRPPPPTATTATTPPTMTTGPAQPTTTTRASPAVPPARKTPRAPEVVAVGPPATTAAGPPPTTTTISPPPPTTTTPPPTVAPRNRKAHIPNPCLVVQNKNLLIKPCQSIKPKLTIMPMRGPF
jgi:hypothetical protein